MTTAKHPNEVALRKGLAIYRDEMSEFVARILRQKPGSRLEQTVANSLTDRQRQDFTNNIRENDGNVPRSIEIGFIPNLVEKNWTDLFQIQFTKATTARNRLRTIRDIRNDLAHDTSGHDITAEKAEANLYFISEALESINRPEQAKEVMGIQSLIRSSEPPQPTQPPLVLSTEQGNGNGNGNGHSLKAWRDAMRPKEDVAEGSFLEADFAANLQQVFDGTAPAMYGDPLEFFRCTYVTNGIHDLLVTATKRVNGKGGNPITQTKTGFGGGKTHSLIALYHLTNSASELSAAPGASTKAEFFKILTDAGVDADQRVDAKVCVLQGTWLSQTISRRTDAGDPLNTLWGEMAWQLGGQTAYEPVGTAARRGTAPGGEELDNMFRLVGPCVILMDEIVNYARNADLDTIGTFFQNLTEAVSRRDNVALIVTLPVTATEAGGERGMEAMAMLENILNRMQTVTQVAQASNDEAFAVVRRRLFQEDCDEAAREDTCQVFYRMYQRGAGDYPSEARETRYLERLRQCYPIHPEIFDRLYEDWSLYHQFQRTRGVLRMMAQTISWLCADNNQSPLIMPGDLPFSEASISEEFVRLLGPQWDAVVAEVDRDNSRTHAIDRQKPERFGSVGGAARRTARAVFLGSATQKAVRGITARQVNLGVVMPGHGAAVYSEAVQTMDGELYHFYRGNDSRYYFDSEENLNKVANDRAAELGNQAVDAEIIRRLSEFNQRNSNHAIISCPQYPADVRDEDFVRLIILRPDQPKPSRSAESDHASEISKTMLSTCGNEVRRTRPNTLLFLAASSDGVREMRAAARRFLAWDSIINGNRRVANLTGDRHRQSSDQQHEASRTLQNALSNAYRWIMAPGQPDPQNAEYETDNWRQIAIQPDIAANALQRFVADDLLVNALTPEALNRHLKERIWNLPNPRYHITVDELWDLLTHNVYLGLRLRNREVLEQCLTEAVKAGVFGRADGYDTATQKYRTLVRGINESGTAHQVSPLTSSTLIVEPDIAQLHLEEEPFPRKGEPSNGDPTPVPTPEPNPTRKPESRLARRLIARKAVAEQDAVSYDFNGTIRDEIARVMAAAGCSVTVEVTVTISKEDGISENAARSLRDNSIMLGIDLTEDVTS